jgi:hypothetical protein
LRGEIVHDKLKLFTNTVESWVSQKLRMTIEMQDGTALKENNTGGANLNFLFNGVLKGLHNPSSKGLAKDFLSLGILKSYLEAYVVQEEVTSSYLGGLSKAYIKGYKRLA